MMKSIRVKCSAIRPCRPLRVSISRRLTRFDHVVEPPAGTGSDAASGNSDGQMGLAGAGTADQNGIALLGDEAAAGEVIDQRLVDGCSLELEVVKILGEWQLGDGELVLDRAGLLLADLSVEKSPTMRWGSCRRLMAVAMISSKAAFMP